jgi:hypothetical protein
MDWAHRHGELFGRGVPGLCTCVIGFLNTPSVRRVFIKWQEEIASSNDGGEHQQLQEKWLGKEQEYQIRDQELLALVLQVNQFPDIKLFPLSFEWVCPNTKNPSAVWAEGTRKTSSEEFTHLTQNPCKALHSHDIANNPDMFIKYPQIQKWIRTVNNVGQIVPGEEQKHCGGAHKISSLKKG